MHQNKRNRRAVAKNGLLQRLPHVSDGADGVGEAAERLKCSWVPSVLPPKFGNVGMACSWEWICFRDSRMSRMMGHGWLSHEARASLRGEELPPVGSRFDGEQEGCSSLLWSPWEWVHRLVLAAAPHR